MLSYWYFLHTYSSSLIYFKSIALLFTQKSLPKQHPTKLKNTRLDHLRYRFKTLSRSTYRSFRGDQYPTISNFSLNTTNTSFVMFNLFLTICTQNLKCHYRIHPSARFYFLDQRGTGTFVFNTSKLFRRWQDFFHLLFNLFFYKIGMLYFGHHSFKKQVLALNWISVSPIKSLWSYISPYLYLRPNPIEAESKWLLQYVLSLNISIAFIFDSVFHKITLRRLTKWGFYTIGSVSVTHNLANLNFTLPVTSENLLMHLFCLRLVCHIKKVTEASHFRDYRWFWTLRS